MPFFTKTEYLSSPTQIWIWTALTFAVTLVAFVIFKRIIHLQRGSSKGGRSKAHDEESGETGNIPLQSVSVVEPEA